MDRLSGTDEVRETWCILTIGVEQTGSTLFLSEWELATANIDQFLDREVKTAESPPGEPRVLESLAATLDEYRFEGVVLFTPSQNTLSVLRSRLIASDAITQPTLRGFTHVGVGELLQRHFHTSSIKEPFPVESITGRDPNSGLAHSEPSAHDVWEVLVDVAPLVPPSHLRGELL